MNELDYDKVAKLDLMTSKEAATYLRANPNTLAKYRMTGDGPTYIQQSARRILYRRSDLDEWLSSRTFKSTSAASMRRSGRQVEA